MAERRTRKTRSVSRKTVETAVAAPQVIAHRLTRMALAGAKPSARDRKEFQRMGAEKVAAFTESWNAMAAQAFQAHQKLALSWMASLWKPGATAQSVTKSAARQTGDAVLDIVEKGLNPIHRRAVANAKRLSRKKVK
ncbi:MAG: polyhydroxyalkanoate granule-associated phasin [Candidatus Competibacter sp.]